jgi:hypothetical protein
MDTTKLDAPIEDITPDFSEVEWKVASEKMSHKVTDYGALDSVKALLAGKVIEIPPETYLNRLYRWLNKNGYTLRRRKVRSVLLLWIEPKIDPKKIEEEESKPQIIS